ncbi:hypothetical protein Klosneuvirus_2_188 [Klosneuvirus KNV1]|uniref:EF-1-gamma C-terminal domain-containing protein n=1 Tax=Klosneuvirus KNV1 TaxID=1977640 RepID=A0A1V0SJ48_9VIRU|nr:hypothetical protein Klosneuvirus_2_188 [Klosneuvirus KNV1]
MSDDEGHEEKKVAYSKIGNLEPVKRAFCNKEFDSFESLVQTQNFKLYSADYIDSSEFDGRPEFILVNKNKGFVQSMDEFRSYFYIAFCCYKKDGKVTFKSYWIVNTNDPLDKVLGSDAEGFKFEQMSDVKEFVNTFKTGGVENAISLAYLH